MFAVAQRSIPRGLSRGCLGDGGSSAIVREKKHIGVFHEVELNQFIKYLSDGCIHITGHGSKFGHVMFAARCDFLKPFQSGLVVKDIQVHGVM